MDIAFGPAWSARRLLTLVALPFAVWGLAAAGCGDSEGTSAAPPAADASTNDGSASGGSSSGDSSQAGTGGSAGGAGGSAGNGGSAGPSAPDRWDGGTQPKTLLQSGEGFLLHGVTQDGYVIYFSQADSSLRAIPVWGGPSEVIYPGSPRVSIRGRAVFAAPTAAAGVPFTVWMHGIKPVRIPGGPVSNSVYSVVNAAMTDPEGKRIVFTRDVGGVLHWIGANIDLTNEVELTIGGTGLCSQVHFAAGHFVTTSGPQSGTYTLDSWDAVLKRTPHYSGPGLNLTYDGVQVAGDRIVYAESQVLKWAPPGGTATTLVPSSVYGFVTSADGAWVAYYGSGTHVTAITPWAPVDLQLSLSTISGPAAIFSPNNAYMAASASSGSARYASVTNGVAIELTPGVDSNLLDRGFTSDSRYVLHAAEGPGIAATPVDGRPAIVLAPLSTFTRPHLVAAHAARVVYVNQDTGQLLARDLDFCSPGGALRGHQLQLRPGPTARRDCRSQDRGLRGEWRRCRCRTKGTLRHRRPLTPLPGSHARHRQNLDDLGAISLAETPHSLPDGTRVDRAVRRHADRVDRHRVRAEVAPRLSVVGALEKAAEPALSFVRAN